MITEEHLNHWLNEMKYQLISIEKEIGVAKLKNVKGIKIAVSPNMDEDVFVSFEYLREKAFTLAGLVKNVEFDMNTDGKELE